MRSPTDSEYAALGKMLIQALPDILKKENPDEQIGVAAFSLSVRLLRTLMGDSKIEDLKPKQPETTPEEPT